jgi:hypothetical protein
MEAAPGKLERMAARTTTKIEHAAAMAIREREDARNFFVRGGKTLLGGT